MEDNQQNEQQQATSGEMGQQAEGTGIPSARHGRETPTATRSASEEASRTMSQGIEETTGGQQGAASTGREPEYYGEEDTP